jgi:hypothetical protein
MKISINQFPFVPLLRIVKVNKKLEKNENYLKEVLKLDF